MKKNKDNLFFYSKNFYKKKYKKLNMFSRLSENLQNYDLKYLLAADTLLMKKFDVKVLNNFLDDFSVNNVIII